MTSTHQTAYHGQSREESWLEPHHVEPGGSIRVQHGPSPFRSASILSERFALSNGVLCIAHEGASLGRGRSEAPGCCLFLIVSRQRRKGRVNMSGQLFAISCLHFSFAQPADNGDLLPDFQFFTRKAGCQGVIGMHIVVNVILRPLRIRMDIESKMKGRPSPLFFARAVKRRGADKASQLHFLGFLCFFLCKLHLLIPIHSFGCACIGQIRSRRRDKGRTWDGFFSVENALVGDHFSYAASAFVLCGNLHAMASWGHIFDPPDIVPGDLCSDDSHTWGARKYLDHQVWRSSVLLKDNPRPILISLMLAEGGRKAFF